MNNFVISCCSTADLCKEHFDARGIRYIYFHYFLDGVSYPDDLGQTISFDDFYKAMANGAETSTSQINAEEFIEYFTPMLLEGKDILHITLSSGLSGVYNSAMIAQRELMDKFPERKVYIVDSLGASSGYGLLIDKLADLRDIGYSLEELRDWAENNKLRMHHWFYSTDLSYYVKGGRISKTAGFVGTVLSICPLLNMDQNGKLIPREKIRTKKAVMKRIVEKMVEYADGGAEYSEKCFISMSACQADAEAVAREVEEKFPKMKGNVVINNIGTTIGSHTGPGTVALFFWGSERKE